MPLFIQFIKTIGRARQRYLRSEQVPLVGALIGLTLIDDTPQRSGTANARAD